jgi:hypothetical protein
LTSTSDHARALAPYLALIDDFVDRTLPAPAFEAAYLRAIKNEQYIFGAPIFPVLQRLFEDADAYVEDPKLRTEPEDHDDEGLRECAVRVREALRRLGFD